MTVSAQIISMVLPTLSPKMASMAGFAQHAWGFGRTIMDESPASLAARKQFLQLDGATAAVQFVLGVTATQLPDEGKWDEVQWDDILPLGALGPAGKVLHTQMKALKGPIPEPELRVEAMREALMKISPVTALQLFRDAKAKQPTQDRSDDELIHQRDEPRTKPQKRTPNRRVRLLG